MIGTIRTSKHSLWIAVDLETGKYFRYLFRKFSGIKLQRSSHDDHITVLTDIVGDFHRAYHGFEIGFQIDMKPQTNGNAIWYPVTCPFMTRLREERKDESSYTTDLHYCIGYLYAGKVQDMVY